MSFQHSKVLVGKKEQNHHLQLDFKSKVKQPQNSLSLVPERASFLQVIDLPFPNPLPKASACTGDVSREAAVKVNRRGKGRRKAQAANGGFLQTLAGFQSQVHSFAPRSISVSVIGVETQRGGF